MCSPRDHAEHTLRTPILIDFAANETKQDVAWAPNADGANQQSLPLSRNEPPQNPAKTERGEHLNEGAWQAALEFQRLAVA